MDSARFDRWARSILTFTTRRSLLALPAALGFGQAPGVLDHVTGKNKKKKRKKCRKPCGLCKRCKRGKCRGQKPNGTDCGQCASCQGGKCVSDCPGGQACSGDVCAVEPECSGFDVVCVDTDDCCSGICVDDDGNGVSACRCSLADQPCLLTGDCCDGTCVGFVCTA